MHEEGTFSCIPCDFKTTSKQIENLHQMILHPEYCCNICGEKKSSEKDIKQHCDAIHEGRKFLCKECKHKTKIKAALLQFPIIP